MSFETEGDRTARIAAAARRIIAAQRLSDEKAHLEEGFEWKIRHIQDEDGRDLWRVESSDGAGMDYRNRRDAEMMIHNTMKSDEMKWRPLKEKEPAPKEKVPPPRSRDCVVTVKDGTLVEDGRFEAGVTYVMEEMEPFDQDMVVVYDKFGEKGTYFRDRFEFVFE